MTEFYVSRAVNGKTKAGVPYRLFRGIHHLPDALTNDHEANDLGIKPVEEMTDDEWRQLGLNGEAWLKDRAAKLQDAADAKAKAEADDAAAKTRLAATIAVKTDATATTADTAATDAPKAS